MVEDAYGSRTIGQMMAAQMNLEKVTGPAFGAQIAARMGPDVVTGGTIAQVIYDRVNIDKLTESLGSQTLGSLPQGFTANIAQQLGKQHTLLHDIAHKPLIASSFAEGLKLGYLEDATVFRDTVRGEAEAVLEEAGVADPLVGLAEKRQQILVCLTRLSQTFSIATGADVASIVKLPDAVTIITLLLLAALVIGEVADEILGEREEGEAA